MQEKKKKKKNMKSLQSIHSNAYCQPTSPTPLLSQNTLFSSSPYCLCKTIKSNESQVR